MASETTTYLYDEFGSLAQVNLPNGDVITYQMDGSNRRVSKFINGNPAWGLVYQDQLNPVARTNPDGSLEAVFVYGSKINVPEYMIKNGINYKFVTDQVGSVRFVVNADTGAIAQELDYSSFGEVLRDTNPGFQPFGFAGGIYDHQTKLVRFGARDYDGQVGRWVSKDPILFEGDTSNLYEYANNNPVDYIDPKGTDSYLTTRWGHVFLVVSDPDNLGGFLVYDFFPESNRSIFTSVDGVVREQRFNSPNAIPGVFIPGSYATQSPAADVSTITRARDLKNLANSGELSFSGLGSGGKSLNCWGFAGAAK